MLLLPGDSRWEAGIPLAFLLFGHWYVLVRFRKDTRYFKLFFEENIFRQFPDRPTETFDSKHDSSDEKDIFHSPQSERKLDPYV